MERFENGDICRLTEQVIFTDPYYSAPVNRHTSPQLDDLAHAFQHDVEAKAAITALKVRRHDCLEMHSRFLLFINHRSAVSLIAKKAWH